MAEPDLKHQLTHLLNSSTGAILYFGFGTGKRSDNKGDGALLMARDKNKVKKTEAKKKCTCDQFYEGICWAADGEVMVLGKGGKHLSSSVLQHMKAAAHLEANSSCKFRSPTPEEEKGLGKETAAALAEEDQDGKAPDGPAAVPDSRPATPAPDSWSAARSNAVHELRELQKALAHTHDQEAKPLIDGLEAIILRLPAEVKTQEQLKEVVHYVGNDPDLKDLDGLEVENVKITFRPHLVAALRQLAAQPHS